jgi:multiple sugar transport system permease protein
MELSASRPLTVAKRPGLLARIVGAETDLQKKDALQGYLFALPWILGLIIFFGGPILASAYYSFTNYHITRSPTWAGLSNYQTAFFSDPLFWPSLGRTFYFASVMVPLSVIGSLILATLLNQSLNGTNVFRSIFFLPHLTPTVAMAVLWTWLLHPQLGPMNALLKDLGLQPYTWLTRRTTVIPSLILISTWSSVGGNNMLIFLAALQGVPEELYEAAQIDGAGPFKKFLHITLPMISPAVLFNIILGVIGALRVFGLAFVATGGGPNYGSWFYALHIYQQGFRYFRLGYGSALSWFFALIVITLTLIQLKLSSRWVYYVGGQ